MAAVSPGPLFTRCGTVSLEGSSIKVTYEAGEVTHAVFVVNARDLRHNRDAVPVPVFARGPQGFTKCGYAHRSLSGRAFIISTSNSLGDLMRSFKTLFFQLPHTFGHQGGDLPTDKHGGARYLISVGYRKT
jgi:hypothetical protein